MENGRVDPSPSFEHLLPFERRTAVRRAQKALRTWPNTVRAARTFGYLAVTSLWGLIACICFLLAFVAGMSAPKTHVYLVLLCLGAVPLLMAVIRYRQAKQSKVKP
jgi:hypothetical protein